VETLEKGFMIKVMSRKNEAGMLVCVLETFEDLGLDVVEARVSCTDTFSLHAIGSSNVNTVLPYHHFIYSPLIMIIIITNGILKIYLLLLK